MLRIDGEYSGDQHATSFLESRQKVLGQMVALGQDEFRENEDEVISLLQP